MEDGAAGHVSMGVCCGWSIMAGLFERGEVDLIVALNTDHDFAEAVARRVSLHALQGDDFDRTIGTIIEMGQRREGRAA